MPIDKSKLLQSLKADLTAASHIKKQWDQKRIEWRNQYEGKPYGNEEAGKSAIISKDLRKQSEWQHASIIDPFVSSNNIVRCYPITFEDAESARQNELLLNTQFCRKFDRYNFMAKSVKVLDQEGTVIIQTGWDYQDAKELVATEVVAVDEYGNQYVTIQEIEQTVVKKNKPTAKVCRNEDIYIDPTCEEDMDKCQFVIYRYETDISTLRKDGRYKNLDKVAKSLGQTSYDYDYRPQDETRFQFKDDPRRKVIVHEYWGNYDVNEDGVAEPIVCAWVNDTIIRLQDNPYPDGKPPFIVVPFHSVPFQMYGEANAALIGDNQKIKTAIIRGVIDNMAQSNNGQVGIRKGALDQVNRKKWSQGRSFEFNGSPNDFWQGSYNPIPNSAFDMIGLMNNEIESLTGVKSFSGGITGSSLGNMLDIATVVPMMDGSTKLLADITDGDQLIGSNGKATTVVKAHEIKYPKQAYDMVFDEETLVKSGGEHLWTVKVQDKSYRTIKDWHTADADTVYSYIQEGKRVSIPKMKEVHTGTKATSTIDPYVLGFWLGDGNNHSARITTEDSEVVKFFEEKGYECVEVKDSSKTGKATMYDVYKKGHKPVRNTATGQFESTESLHSELRDLNLHAGYGGEKHIPDMFMNATYEEKMELIRGLMDSDGFAHSGSFVQFAQSEGRLKDDFIKLLQTLGLKVSIRVKDKDKCNEQKLKRCERTGSEMIWSRRDVYEIGFTPWSNPFKLTRKAEKWKLPRINTVKITSMDKVDKVLMRCLTVDSEDKLFAVTDRFILTHNTATGARGAMDATSVRRMNIVRNIAENLVKPLLRKWMAYNAEFLEEEEVVRVTNEEFVPIRKDDLSGNIDIDLSISTAEDQAAKAQELSFLLQTLGNNMPMEVTQMLMAEVLELSRMPEKAKQIREFKPEADPMQEELKKLEMQRLQLENMKLQSEIERNMARAGEDQVDIALKEQKIAVEAAKARSLHTKSDLDDLEFLRRDEGVDLQAELAKLKAKHDAEVEKMVLAHRAGLDVEAIRAMQKDKTLASKG